MNIGFRKRMGRDILWIASIAVVYFIIARFSLSFLFKPEGIAAIWPLTGIFLSAVLLTRRIARPYLIGTLFFTDLVAEIMAGTPFAVSVVYAGALAGDAIIGSWLMIRFVGETITFRKVKDVLGFLLLTVLLSNALMSVVAALAARIFIGVPFRTSWFWWFSSDGLGSILSTPLIMSFAYYLRTGFREFKRFQLIEAAILFLSMAIINNYLFTHFTDDSRSTLLLSLFTFPFLFWASLRFGVLGAAAGSIILAIDILRNTISGQFLHFGAASNLETIIFVQIYIAMISVPSILFASLITERDQARKSLMEQHERLAHILDSIDALVYVADLKTHELLFINKYGKKMFGDVTGKKCWQAIQKGQNGPCDFCSNFRLLTEQGEPSGVYNWEIKNTITGRWFDCRDSAIMWTDGKLVRMEIAMDITDIKTAREALVKLNTELDQRVKERTSEIEKKNTELEKFNRLFVGRELRMVELKNQVKNLEKQIEDMKKEFDAKKNN